MIMKGNWIKKIGLCVCSVMLMVIFLTVSTTDKMSQIGRGFLADLYEDVAITSAIKLPETAMSLSTTVTPITSTFVDMLQHFVGYAGYEKGMFINLHLFNLHTYISFPCTV